MPAILVARHWIKAVAAVWPSLGLPAYPAKYQGCPTAHGPRANNRDRGAPPASTSQRTSRELVPEPAVELFILAGQFRPKPHPPTKQWPSLLATAPPASAASF